MAHRLVLFLSVSLDVAGASVQFPPLPGFLPVKACCATSIDVPLFEEAHQDDFVQCALKCATKCRDEYNGKCNYFQIAQLVNSRFKCSVHGGTCVHSSDKICGGTQTWQRTAFNKDIAGLEAERCYTEPAWRAQKLWNFTGAFERCGPSSVCLQGHGCQNSCTADEECDSFPMRVCAGESHTGKCKHKGLFGRAAGHDVGAAFAFFIISGLALSAGIGGGGLYVPLLMILLGFTAHEATGLSQALLAGGASSTLVYNMRQRHPSGTKPMIDYNLVAVMGPNLLIGALIGSALNIATPSWFILALLTTILSHSAWKTLQKAIKTLRRERAGEVQGMPANDGRLSHNVIERAIAKVRSICGWHGRLNDEIEAKDSPSTPIKSSVDPSGSLADLQTLPPLPRPSAVFQDTAPTMAVVHDVEAAKLQATLDQITLFEASPSDSGASPIRPGASPLRSSPNAWGSAMPSLFRGPTSPDRFMFASRCRNDVIEAQRPIVEAQPQFPRASISQFVLMWLVVIFCILIRGGRASPGLVHYCGPLYWSFTAVAIQALALLSFMGARRAVQSAPAAPGDEDVFHWTVGAAWKVAIYSLGAGTLAALCGIGGGMILGPVLLDLGVLPQVQSATTATTLLVLSSSSALAFLVQGAAPMDYALFLAFATAAGAVIGKAVMGYLIKLYRRPSAIIFLLGGIILASVIVIAVTGTIDVINDIQKGQGLGFKSICGTRSGNALDEA